MVVWQCLVNRVTHSMAHLHKPAAAPDPLSIVHKVATNQFTLSGPSVVTRASLSLLGTLVLKVCGRQCLVACLEHRLDKCW